MTKEQVDKRNILLIRAEEAIDRGAHSEMSLKQAELYMQLAEIIKG